MIINLRADKISVKELLEKEDIGYVHLNMRYFMFAGVLCRIIDGELFISQYGFPIPSDCWLVNDQGNVFVDGFSDEDAMLFKLSIKGSVHPSVKFLDITLTGN